MITADVIVDLQYGDSAKGKVAHFLCGTGNYSHVLRYNGGCNAGHTIFHGGRRFVTHHIPVGVFYGVKSIIGNGCVLDPEQFFKELAELREGGIDVEGKVFVARNTHIITGSHRAEDGAESTIGTTKRGNGPAYRDKYARTGIRAESVSELRPFLIDLYDEFHHNLNEVTVLGEGAQAFGIDIDWGDYPFVTSSHCTVAGLLQNAIPVQSVCNVWGVAKIYETYVGSKDFEPKDEVFERIRKIGGEFGSTTGRPRKCNWMNMNLLEQAIRINGVTHVVISKMDVLREVGVWKLIQNGEILPFSGERAIKAYILNHLLSLGLQANKIFFSEHADKI